MIIPAIVLAIVIAVIVISFCFAVDPVLGCRSIVPTVVVSGFLILTVHWISLTGLPSALVETYQAPISTSTTASGGGTFIKDNQLRMMPVV
jgi:hypothetical protein